MNEQDTKAFKAWYKANGLDDEFASQETWQAALAYRDAQPAQVQHQVVRDLVDALKLALDSHGVFLASDPPQEAWKHRNVDQIGLAAIAAAKEAGYE